MLLMPLYPLHIHEIIAIDRECFVDPYTENQFREFFRDTHAHAVGVQSSYKIIAFATYIDAPGQSVEIRKIGVLPEYRRQGIGTNLANHATRRGAKIHASEECLPAQLFLKAIGFKAAKIVPNYFECGEAAILFFRGSMDAQCAGKHEEASA